MGWVPPTNVFPEQPPANTVYMTDAPPPYPGITGFSGYAASAPQQPQGAVGGGGFASAADAKAAEAAGPPTQNGWYDPNQPHAAYVPQPHANEQPPSYDDSMKKHN